jgi:hypothetical protein
VHVAWHEILPLVDAIEARLTAIEEQLGIGAEGSPGIAGEGPETAAETPREEPGRGEEPPEESAAPD